MKKVVIIFGLVLFLAGFANAQEKLAAGTKVAEGDTHSLFGNYLVELLKEPVKLEGEFVNKYRISFEKSPVIVFVTVDEEEKCKNYIVVSDGLSVMYKCNGKYFGIGPIDEKYKKEGFVTDLKNLDKSNYYHQKVLILGQQEEVDATSLIASYFPSLFNPIAGL
jgi:hypothetical protein